MKLFKLSKAPVHSCGDACHVKNDASGVPFLSCSARVEERKKSKRMERTSSMTLRWMEAATVPNRNTVSHPTRRRKLRTDRKWQRRSLRLAVFGSIPMICFFPPQAPRGARQRKSMPGMYYPSSPMMFILRHKPTSKRPFTMRSARHW